MIDLHCHILPGVDDGARSMEETLEMAQIYELLDYRYVVATPHYVPGHTQTITGEWIFQKISEINEVLKQKGMHLTVLPGMEIAMDSSIPELLAKNMIIPLADKAHVLIETPFQWIAPGWVNMIDKLLSRGFYVIMAHPERCLHLGKKASLIEELIGAGVYFQVNWGSFTGYFGRGALKLAHFLANNGFIHLMASDSHDSDVRSPKIVSRATEKVRLLVGDENFDLISKSNPMKVVKGEPLNAMKKFDTNSRIRKSFEWMFFKKK